MKWHFVILRFLAVIAFSVLLLSLYPHTLAEVVVATATLPPAAPQAQIIFLPMISKSSIDANLLSNGGFETGDLTGIASQAGGSSCQVLLNGYTITTTIIHSGIYSLGESHNYPFDDIGQGRCFTTDRHTAIANRSYTFSLWYNFTINQGGGSFAVLIIWQDGSGFQVLQSTLLDILQSSNGWRNASILIAAPNDATTFAINVRSFTMPAAGGSAVTAYIDDMSVR